MSLILTFDDEAGAGAELAAALGWSHARIDRHPFPDGETRLRLPPRLPAHVVLRCSLHRPNGKLTELLLAAAGARELGAQRLTLVCPYLGYMRQDMAFAPGEVVSQRHMGRLLGATFDHVITVDPHLHRIASLDEIMPAGRGVALSAAALLGAYVGRRLPGAIIVGPDEEAAPWARRAAAAGSLQHAVCTKVRHGDREVEVSMPDQPVRARPVVLLDDVASTGGTLVAAARGLLAAGAASVDVAVTHALFVGDALEQVRAAGIRHVWSSDSIVHPSNAVSVVPLLSQALVELR